MVDAGAGVMKEGKRERGRVGKRQGVVFILNSRQMESR